MTDDASSESSTLGLPPALLSELELARRAGLFDEAYYSATDDARRAGMHPFAHYMEAGEKRGFAPAPGFDPAYYLLHNPDVAAAGVSPLIHYLHHGRSEGRKPAPGDGPDADVEYRRWLAEFDSWPAERLDGLRQESRHWAVRPKISVVMPTYNTDETYLRAAIESVVAQSYENWEFCIADDASPQEQTRSLLSEYGRRDPRIKIAFREANGHISEATNTALAIATGDFVAFLDHDDELTPNALHFVAKAIREHPDAGLIYSDEDKKSADGHRRGPHFKGDWNLDQLYSQNYLCHLLVVRHDVVDRIGGLRAGVEGSQDYDLILRSLAHISPGQVVHIPRVLYHWRSVPGSTALSLDSKSYAVAAAVKALTDHFAERRESVTVESVQNSTIYRVRRRVPDPAPHVDIIVPTRNRRDLLTACVGSIMRLTDYPNYTINIVDNRSDDPETLAYLADMSARDSRVRIIPCDMDFNFSAINNYAVARVEGPVLVLLNNDVEVISPGWLGELVSQALRPDVGCVGAKLYYANDTIQHAGIVLGVGGVAGHSHKKRPRGDSGYFGRLLTIHQVSAVTGACLCVRKEIFEAVGGLDAENLKVAFNDVDFCMKVQAAGYRNIFTPHAELYHYESLSRGYEDNPEKKDRFARETAFMKSKWGATFASDPFFSPNLSYATENFGLAWPPRTVD